MPHCVLQYPFNKDFILMWDWAESKVVTNHAQATPIKETFSFGSEKQCYHIISDYMSSTSHHSSALWRHVEKMYHKICFFITTIGLIQCFKKRYMGKAHDQMATDDIYTCVNPSNTS